MDNLVNIGYILVLGLGIAISPVPIIVVILILFSDRAKTNGIAFLAGWIAGMLIVGALVTVLAGAGNALSSDFYSASTYTIKLLMGLIFLAMALKNWRSRPKEGEEPEPPKWLARIDGVRPSGSVALGTMNTSLNPKNLSLVLAAALTIEQVGLSGTSAWLTPALFIIIASSTVAIPVLYYVFAGDNAEKTLTGWKAWLTSNSNTILALLFLVLGLQLLVEALGGLRV